ncbi:hypothetical protein SSBR45G_60230 [Bradyrhizobium sp. SSBR45G]|uniref:outer membrane protein n=1 Tax=unclassified Bradyrhizobium TaxID=2631580 RepID=UPI002342964A|nr:MULTISPECIES: outer membrane beta-barrel protein [unclassified Bradyrhizobium]GLH81114.1 hypothetical protein SSBR45G_60230 [Bradyrhizobium sp. SSBR45G]GLH88513.1 hypothetical protein SSBR45R_59740 [Bradyrhizobium sp. SSBR45R]
MRGLVVAVAVCGMASAAQAADLSDLPILRGGLTEGVSSARTNWDGYYVGGQLGYATSDIDFSRSALSLTNYIFRNSVLQGPTSSWSVLNKTHVQGTGFGGFVGRNFQWEDTVFGLELNYNYYNRMVGSTSGGLALGIVNPTGVSPPSGHTYTYNTSVSSSAMLRIKDVTTLRGRIGWAGDSFLPYVFGGVALGRMEVSRSASTSVSLQDDYSTTATVGGVTVTIPQSTTTSIPSLSTTYAEQRSNSFVGGWTGGLGFEYMVWGGLFARGEWEYVKFLSVKDTSVTLNSFRAGVGYKF